MRLYFWLQGFLSGINTYTHANTMEDYIRHTSFYLREEFNTYYEVTMKSDKDVFGNYLTLDGTITPYSHYKIAFEKAWQAQW